MLNLDRFSTSKVVPKEKVIVVKVKPQRLAELAESREAGLGKKRVQDVSKKVAGSGQQVKTSTSSKTITRTYLGPILPGVQKQGAVRGQARNNDMFVARLLICTGLDINHDVIIQLRMSSFPI
jgi:hypothetical protein